MKERSDYGLPDRLRPHEVLRAARRQLNADIASTFEELRAGDISGRAKAYRSLVETGYSPAQAAAACGFEASAPADTATPMGPRNELD